MPSAGRRVLITGGSGMIGAHLVRRCLQDGDDVTVVTRSQACPPSLIEIADRIRLCRVDLRDQDAVAGMVAAANPDVVAHLASTAFNPPPSVPLHLQVNVLGMANLLEALSERPGVRIVHAGSAAQYGDGGDLTEDMAERPSNWLGISKTCAAAVLHAAGRMYGLETVELRLFTPFGPWERPSRLIPHTILSALRGKDVELGDGRPERDYIYVGDVVEAFAVAMSRPLASGSVINIGSGVGRSVAEVAGRILELMGRPVGLRLGARPLRPDEIWKASANIARAKALLNWRPHLDFDEGLQRSIGWFKTQAALDGAAC
jgi:nucleoside-diphosphate-sugar epimerase